jgi:hypothetical protein
MIEFTHAFTDILYEDDVKVLSICDYGDVIFYNEFQKIENLVYDFNLKCDIIKVKIYIKHNELPEWYKNIF